MNCRRTAQLLSDAFEGRLPEREAALVAAHLRACPACCRLQEQLLSDRALLRQMPQQLPIGETDAFGQAMQRWTADSKRRDRMWLDWLFGSRLPSRSQNESRDSRREGRAAWAVSPGRAAAAFFLAALLLAVWTHERGAGTSRRGVASGLPAGGIALAPPSSPIVGSSAPDTGTARTRRAPLPAAHRPRQASRIAPGTSPLREARRHSLPLAGLRVQPRAVGDLAYVNRDPEDELRQWVPLRPGEWERIEERIRRSVQVRDDFITLPFPRLASTSERQIARAVENYKREAAIVDPRLSHEVTCGFKATALADICRQLQEDTGIQLAAGPSVADEKVTLLGEKLPLRGVMRALSQPFGYTWLRSKKEGGDYRYELMQDLRSQLLEEELRNRDRNAALLDLDREMGEYQPYLNLSPDEALARAATASPEEKKRLEYLAGKGWGPAQLYSRLTPADLAALRAGQKLSFNAVAGPGAQPLPPEMTRSVIASLRDYRIVRRGDSFDAAPAKYLPDGVPPAAVPEAQPMVSLSLDRSELGQLTLHGYSGFYIGTPPNCLQLMGDDDHNLAVGMSPTVRSPQNAAANARFAHDPALAPRVTVQPVARRQTSGVTPDESQSKIQNPKSKIEKLTSADVLEALHRATGLPIVADYYTRLYPAAQVEVRNTRLFDALNRLADMMRLRWSKDADHGAGGWLQFRSADFYNDRLKEVPNRLLSRWAASRRRHGALTLDDLIEIAQLTDAQLDSSTMAEGARVLYGLEEWDMARRSELRPNWHFLATLSPEQRQMAQSRSGLPISRMSLAQQQQFVSLLPSQPQRLPSLEELSQASLQVDYTMPGDYQWTPPVRDATPAERMQASPRVREHTREAALLAAQQIDPQVTEAQISPTEVGLKLTFSLGGPQAHFTPFVLHADMHNLIGTLPQPVAH